MNKTSESVFNKSPFHLEEVETQKAGMTPRKQVRNDFDHAVRKQFLIYLKKYYHEPLSKVLSSAELEGMSRSCPAAYNVHHQLPLNLGGKNYDTHVFNQWVSEHADSLGFVVTATCSKKLSHDEQVARTDKIKIVLNDMLNPKALKKYHPESSEEELTAMGKKNFQKLFSSHLLFVDRNFHDNEINPFIEEELNNAIRQARIKAIKEHKQYLDEDNLSLTIKHLPVTNYLFYVPSENNGPNHNKMAINLSKKSRDY